MDSADRSPGAVRSLRLLLLFFILSGAAGLIYQVVWVRQFGNIFGNTVHSASLVIAVFMCGLGLGAALAGRWADRRYAADPVAPLGLYARVEFGIALLATVVAVVLPHLVELSAPFSAYTRGGNGWYTLSAGSYVARYALAVLLLLPVTTLMGATLTLLVRFVVAADVSLAGWRIGMLYAANTLGAAAGALLVDTALIPGIGLRSTQLVAVLANLVAGLGALRLAARAGDAAPASSPPGAPVPVISPAPAARVPVGMVSAAIFLAGFAAMGMEIVWFRHLSSMQAGVRAVYSQILVVVLLGIVAGSLAGGWLERRTRRPVEIFLACQAFFVAASVAGLAAYHFTMMQDQLAPHLASLNALPAWARHLWRYGLRLLPDLYVVGIPAVFLGATFPLANACIQRTEAAVGWRAGVLYLANTLGGVAGSIAGGFMLLPFLGSWGAVAVLLGAAGLGVALMFAAMRATGPGGRGLPAAFAGSLAVMAAALAFWILHDPAFLVMRPIDHHMKEPDVRLLAIGESTTEVAVVLQHSGDRYLFTDGHPMSSTTYDGQRYMRAMSHLPLLMMDAPERVLVICFGVGNTLHAASLHPSVQTLEIADLSANILGLSGWFGDANRGVLKDPRVRVFVNDGRQHLRMSDRDRFDLITLEPPPISFAGVSSLYSREFYELALSRLRPGGYLTQWLPPDQVSDEAMRAIVKAFIEVFPHAVLLSGSEMELILMGSAAGEVVVDPDRVLRALAARPAVQADLRRYSMARMTEIVGTFVSDAGSLFRATEDDAPITDDLPIMEYAQVIPGIDARVPFSLYNVDRVAGWCPRCFSGGSPVAPMTDLDEYLSLVNTLYLRRHRQEKPPRYEDLPAAAKEAVRASPYLQRYYTVPAAPAGSAPDASGAPSPVNR